MLVCRPAACARCSRADQPLPPPGSGLSMIGWMPGAPACRILAREPCRSAVEASNSALAPLWWNMVRRPPSRSTMTSVNDVTAPASRRTPAVSMPSRAHSASRKAACSSSPTAPSTRDGEGRAEQAQVNGHVEGRSAGAQGYLLDGGQVIQRPGRRQSPFRHRPESSRRTGSRARGVRDVAHSERSTGSVTWRSASSSRWGRSAALARASW